MSFTLLASMEMPDGYSGKVAQTMVLPGLSIKTNRPIKKLPNQSFGLYQLNNHRKSIVMAHEIYIAVRDSQKKPLHAGFIEYLLLNQSIIPIEFQPWVIFFWGTILEGSQKVVHVPCLYWDNRRQIWQVGTEPLHAGLGQHCLAACSL